MMHGLKDNIVKSSLLFKNQLLKTPIGQPLFWILVGNVADMDHSLSFCFQDLTNQENGQTNIICYILWNGSCCCLHARWESILIKRKYCNPEYLAQSNFVQCKSRQHYKVWTIWSIHVWNKAHLVTITAEPSQYLQNQRKQTSIVYCYSFFVNNFVKWFQSNSFHIA